MTNKPLAIKTTFWNDTFAVYHANVNESKLWPEKYLGFNVIRA